MERNEETLSTRDLASPNERVAEGRTADDDAGNGAVPEGQPGVHDQPREGTSRPPGEDEPQLAADERAGTSSSERTQLPATEQAPAHARPEGSASDTRPWTPTPALGVARPTLSLAIDRQRRRRPLRRGNRTAVQRNRRAGWGRRPRTSAGRCYRPRWTPRSSNGGRRSKLGLSTNPVGRSRTPIVWSRISCSNSQRGLQRNGNGSKPSGAAGRTSPPRTCGSRCSAIGPSFSACSPPDMKAGSREVPRIVAGPHGDLASITRLGIIRRGAPGAARTWPTRSSCSSACRMIVACLELTRRLSTVPRRFAW